MVDRTHLKTIGTLVLVSSLAFIGITLIWWNNAHSSTQWIFSSLDYYMSETGFSNPNLKVGQPVPVNNQIAFYPGFLEVIPEWNESSWYLLQWQVEDPVTTDPANGTGPALVDSLLGNSLFVTRSSELQLAVFQPAGEPGYTFELHLSGGSLSAGGGRNMFLSTNPVSPVPMSKDVFLNISVHVEEMRTNGTAPENVVQVFVGMVLKCMNNGSDGDNDTLFIQGIITNTHGNRFYAAGNPIIKCGLYANLISGDLLDTGTGIFTDLNMHVTEFLRSALPRTYSWVDEYGQAQEKVYADQDTVHWFLTEIYMGLETQGDALGIVQLSDFSLLEGISKEN